MKNRKGKIKSKQADKMDLLPTVWYDIHICL